MRRPYDHRIPNWNPNYTIDYFSSLIGRTYYTTSTTPKESVCLYYPKQKKFDKIKGIHTLNLLLLNH